MGWAWLLGSGWVDIYRLTIKGPVSTCRVFLHATIGAGEIHIRFDLGQDISDLNRDPSKSFEVKNTPILGMDNDTIREFVKNIEVKDPAKSIGNSIDMVDDINKTSKDIIKAGGVTEYAKDKAGELNDKAKDKIQELSDKLF